MSAHVAASSQKKPFYKVLYVQVLALPAHVQTPTTTVRGIGDMTALTAVAAAK
jgi:hypothetical protein